METVCDGAGHGVWGRWHAHRQKAKPSLLAAPPPAEPVPVVSTLQPCTRERGFDSSVSPLNRHTSSTIKRLLGNLILHSPPYGNTGHRTSKGLLILSLMISSRGWDGTRH